MTDDVENLLQISYCTLQQIPYVYLESYVTSILIIIFIVNDYSYVNRWFWIFWSGGRHPSRSFRMSAHPAGAGMGTQLGWA
jgi:hypothetical protein